MAATRSLKQPDYEALAEFRYQIRRYVRVSEDAARGAGIEPQHHQLLLAVKGMRAGEKPRIAYLAEHLQIQHHSAVELVNRLAKRGLIVRTRGDEDRREVLVQLTAVGERILGELTLHLRTELQTAAPALVATLRKLASRKQAAPDPAPHKGPRAGAGKCPPDKPNPRGNGIPSIQGLARGRSARGTVPWGRVPA